MKKVLVLIIRILAVIGMALALQAYEFNIWDRVKAFEC
jgi:uncharacterized protein YxeA